MLGCRCSLFCCYIHGLILFFHVQTSELKSALLLGSGVKYGDPSSPLNVQNDVKAAIANGNGVRGITSTFMGATCVLMQFPGDV